MVTERIRGRRGVGLQDLVSVGDCAGSLEDLWSETGCLWVKRERRRVWCCGFWVRVRLGAVDRGRMVG